MKQPYLVTLMVTLLITQVFAEESSVEVTEQDTKKVKPLIKDERDKLSYSFGVNIGKNLKQQGVDVSLEALTQGIKDILLDLDPLMEQKEINEVLMAHRTERLAKQAEKRQQMAEKNLQAGDAFLTENQKKTGVVVLPSGLQYEVIKLGTGKMPKPEDTVTTHYRGTFIDGKEFDSSYERGEPATFPVKGVIAGWTEALQLMKEGAKWKLFVPAKLAYGENGRGKIEPNSTLIFEIELISVNPKETSSDTK